MTEVGETELRWNGAGSDVISGAVVRDLVSRNEREIESLLRVLDEALREAEEAERLVAAHPAASLVPDEPVETRAAVPSAGAPAGRGSSRSRPRTTVDPRPRTAASRTDGANGRKIAVTTPGTALSGQSATGAASTTSPGVSSLFRSHWVWKSGIALTAIAILLLKFG
jgi:hypothetical protein